MYIALVVSYLGLLGQNSLGVDGGHAEKGNDPHPEDGPRAADQNGAAGAHNIACAHLGGNGGGKGLEGAESALPLSAAHGEFAKGAAHALTKAADLYKAGLDGEKDAGAYQEQHKDVV